MDDKHQKYLMKRRRFGYGWTPATWRGWLFFLLQLIIVAVAATFLPAKPAHPTASESIRFFIIVACTVITIILLSIQTGPRARWRWGKKSGDNPDEDF